MKDSSKSLFYFPQQSAFKNGSCSKELFPSKKKESTLLLTNHGSVVSSSENTGQLACEHLQQESKVLHRENKPCRALVGLCVFFLTEMKIIVFQSFFTVCNSSFSIPKSTLRKPFNFCIVSRIPFQLSLMPDNLDFLLLLEPSLGRRTSQPYSLYYTTQASVWLTVRL